MDPWIYSCHHLAAGDSAQYLRGDGGLTSVHFDCTITNSSVVGRVMLRMHQTAGAPNQIIGSKVFPARTRLVFGIRIHLEARSDNLNDTWEERRILSIGNGNGDLVTLDRSDTALRVTRLGTVLGSLGSFPVGTEMYLEGDITFHSSTGAATFRIDGDEVLTLTGINTAGVTVGSGASVLNMWNLRRATSNSTINFSDWYINPDNVFYGPINPNWRPVVADVAATGWTPDSGTDLYARLATVGTGYIDSTAVGDEARFELDPIAPTSNSIIAVVPVIVSEAPEGGAPLVALDFKRGVDQTATEGLVTGSAGPRSQARVHLLQPNGSAWSPTAVNDSELVLTAA